MGSAATRHPIRQAAASGSRWPVVSVDKVGYHSLDDLLPDFRPAPAGLAAAFDLAPLWTGGSWGEGWGLERESLKSDSHQNNVFPSLSS